MTDFLREVVDCFALLLPFAFATNRPLEPVKQNSKWIKKAWFLAEMLLLLSQNDNVISASQISLK